MRHPAQQRPTLATRPRPASHWAGTLAVTVISLLVGVAAFQIVSRAQLSRAAQTPTPQAQQPDQQPDQQPTSTGPGKPRPTANGELLRAAAPLDQVLQDQGSTIDLPDGRTLWIFADTLQQDRRPTFFVTSSAALTERDGRQVKYALTERGTPTEFLPRTTQEKRTSRDGVRYVAVWPTGSTLLPDGRIVIAYAKYDVTVQEQRYVFLGSGLFSFRYTSAAAFRQGARATRIADDIWAPTDGEVRSPVYADGYVYFSQCQEFRCFALRTTPDAMADRAGYRWWSGVGWSAQRGERRPVTIGSRTPGGNASVVRLPSGLFAMTDTEVGAPSAYGLLWVAPRPWGPWSRASSFIMPGCTGAGCYGLNLHPSLSPARTLRVSYSTVSGPRVRVVDVPVSIAANGAAISVR